MDQYLHEITQKFARVDAGTAKGREMIYRSDFENLLKQIFHTDSKVKEINHDSTNDGGNKPDFVVSKNSVPILYIEAKDIGINLDKVEKSEQMDRYFGYQNLVLTDYLEFRFYRNGEKYGEPISIASYNIKDRTIVPKPENFPLLEKTLVDFANSHKEPIKRGAHLSKIMGGKAQRIRDNVREMLLIEKDEYSDLKKIETVVKKNLITDLDHESFADMYAQTLVYGLFAARYNDTTKETFSRAEARDLISKSNPFLRSFFDHIAGESFPGRLRYIVDELCEVFTHADVEKLLHDFYGKEKDKDPIIHFYEDFLREYDSKKKMEMGVFYTPQPIVKFIVKTVDAILKEEFGLNEGLSNTSKIQIEVKEENLKGKLVKVNKEFFKVQILDVATGTGTFLNEVIDIVHQGFSGQEGRWPSYVKDSLLPRLHGFELMIASYTIAHLKLSMKLSETGAGDIKQRLGVYLTNSLDKPVEYGQQLPLFGLMDSIAAESRDASRIKAEYPIMCVIGNPPYSGVSQNKEYTENSVYKVEPGGKVKLKEKKHWLDDDYVKFIRFAESLIEKNNEGVIGMITAHGYIDNPTFRGMRWHLRKTFDKVFVVDLHGNSNKKESAPDGGKDENVFDIKTGVSIMFGVKNNIKPKNELARIFKADLYGTRVEKFTKLGSLDLNNFEWAELPDESDVWILEGEGKSEYQKGFSVSELFPKNTTGIVTGMDKLSIFFTKEELQKKTHEILNSNDPFNEFAVKDGRRTKKEDRIKELRVASSDAPTPIAYRPFDIRWMYYTTGSEVWINSPRPEIMQNFLSKENLGLVTNRQVKAGDQWNHVLVSENIIESSYLSNKTSEIGTVLPLYIYDQIGEKIPNLNPKIWSRISKIVGDSTPENILDYIYAYLHSSRYRDKFREFLKTDFPRVPYPKNKEQFWSLVSIGTQLRRLHLIRSPDTSNLVTTFPISGSDVIEKIDIKENRVYINTEQYFGNVPELAWNFQIGGYRPAQKWLKDRKDRKLSSEDISHYQKIIYVLIKTDELMKEVDKIL